MTREEKIHVLLRSPVILSIVAVAALAAADGLAQCPVPAEVDHLEIARTGTSGAVLQWTLPEGALASDVVRGDLRGGRVNVIGVGQTCMARDLTDATTFTDVANPSAGSGFWYLVRGNGDCGKGSWGFENQTGSSVARITECGCIPDFSVTAPDRFVDGWITISDRRTCLEWERKNTVSAMHSMNNLYTWYDLVSDVPSPSWMTRMNEEVFAGHRDWRLPRSTGPLGDPTGDLPELESILIVPCPGDPYPCIDPAFGPFPASAGGCDPTYCNPDHPVYWSLSTDPGSPAYGWAVDFVSGTWAYSRKNSYVWYVRAVRGSLYGE